MTYTRGDVLLLWSFVLSLQAHKNCQNMTEIEAKVSYVKLARSLKTYGVSFFLVKVRRTSSLNMFDGLQNSVLIIFALDTFESLGFFTFVYSLLCYYMSGHPFQLQLGTIKSYTIVFSFESPPPCCCRGNPPVTDTLYLLDNVKTALSVHG